MVRAGRGPDEQRQPCSRPVHPRTAGRPDPDGIATLTGPRRLLSLTLLACVASRPASAVGSPAETETARQFAGFFMQSCLPYAGDPDGLRAWAHRIGLRTVPEQARAAFLHGAPGQAFDGSNPSGKFALVSSDDGICSIATDQAIQQLAVDSLETDLRQSGIAFRLVIERDDKLIPVIHDREYLATKNGRGWRILLATIKGDKGGQAMLTAAPE